MGKDREKRRAEVKSPLGSLLEQLTASFPTKNPEAGRSDCLLLLDPVEPFLIRTEAESAVTSYPTNRFIHELKRQGTKSLKCLSEWPCVDGWKENLSPALTLG